MSSKVELSKTDMIAIENNDSGYINNKGAKLYNEDTFDMSVEYYRLAATMGDTHAISNLGYCYLYGRSIEKNTSLAIAYFTVAAKKGDIDAAYKLGDIYSTDKYVKKDDELSIYYFNYAAALLISEDWNEYEDIVHIIRLQDYPSLCFALGRNMCIGGLMNTNLKLSYQFLKHAEIGYRYAIENGSDFYKEAYESVLEYLEKEEFASFKDEIDREFSGEDIEEDIF